MLTSPADRRALRALDKEIASLLSLLGLDPRSRSRFGAVVAPDRGPSKLEEIRAISQRRNGQADEAPGRGGD